MTDRRSLGPARPAPRDIADPRRRALLRGAVASLVACPLASACEFIELEASDGPPGGADGFPFSLSDDTYAALRSVGGHACIQLGPIAAIVFRASDDTVLAFERFCPHQQNTIASCDGSVPAQVSYNADLQQITCPWHNARFRTTGERINEVAPRDLVVFPVDFDPTSGEARIRFGGPR